PRRQTIHKRGRRVVEQMRVVHTEHDPPTAVGREMTHRPQESTQPTIIGTIRGQEVRNRAERDRRRRPRRPHPLDAAAGRAPPRHRPPPPPRLAHPGIPPPAPPGPPRLTVGRGDEPQLLIPTDERPSLHRRTSRTRHPRHPPSIVVSAASDLA